MNIWAEKYRPTTLDELVFPKKDKEKIKSWLASGEIPNLGIFGTTPGTGKSSLLNVLIEQMDVETTWLNGSKDNGIDVIRNDVGGFVRTKSIMGNHKIVAIDEADYLTINAQTALRPDIENYAKNARFIFTGNYPERIIEPVLDRLQIFDLDDIYSRNKKELGGQIYKRLHDILETENITYEKKDLINVVSTLYPSTRSMLMFMQNNIIDGTLAFDDITKPDDSFVTLVDALKIRKFKVIKPAVQEILVPDNFYSYIYKNLDAIFKIESQPTVILEMADYQDYSQRARNKHIPLLAFCVKMISDSDVKFI